MGLDPDLQEDGHPLWVVFYWFLVASSRSSSVHSIVARNAQVISLNEESFAFCVGGKPGIRSVLVGCRKLRAWVPLIARRCHVPRTLRVMFAPGRQPVHLACSRVQVHVVPCLLVSDNPVAQWIPPPFNLWGRVSLSFSTSQKRMPIFFPQNPLGRD